MLSDITLPHQVFLVRDEARIIVDYCNCELSYVIDPDSDECNLELLVNRLDELVSKAKEEIELDLMILN